jgi:uncharacterized membrane protein
MAKLFSIRPGISFKGRAFKGVRGWAGKPLHPPLTDFPIAAYVLAGAFDLISYFSADEAAEGARSGVAHDFFVAGTYVIIAGAIVSLGAAVTGFWDWWKGIDRDPSGPLGKAKHTQVWRTINWHATVMLTVTAIVIVDIIVRLARFDQGFADLATMLLSVVSAALVSFGAAYGGSLVYDYQFNIESLEGSTVWDETEQDQLPSDKASSDG